MKSVLKTLSVFFSFSAFGLVMAIQAQGQTCSGPATPHVRLCNVIKSSAPLISQATHSGIGGNFQGPTVIKVPSWVPGRLGDYYMYFAAHNGHYIRLAYANNLAGPWTNYAPGSLKDTQVAPFTNTIASPDIHIFDSTGKIRMYFHTDSYPGSTEQWSGVAESTDGINFTLSSTQNIAKYYMRVFQWAGSFFGLQKGWSTAPAELGVSTNGIAKFNFIKTMSQGSVRHMGTLLKGNILLVFFSRIGDAPERIFLSTIDLAAGAPSTWDFSNAIEVLRPTLAFEGANYPIVASYKGPATNVNEVRDPFVFEEGGKTYLYYTVAGESGIAMAELQYEMVTSTTPGIATVSLTSPANGSSYAQGAAVPLAATATAQSGATVTKVEFYDGNVKLGEDLTSPYTLSVSTLAVGSHSLTAKAIASTGLSKSSTTVSVTITSTSSSIAVGSRVKTTQSTTVYAKSPGGDGKGTQPAGALGTVIQGPLTNTQGKWWKVNYDSGYDGWTLESALTLN